MPRTGLRRADADVVGRRAPPATRAGDDVARAEALLDEVRPVVEALDLASVHAQVEALGA